MPVFRVFLPGLCCRGAYRWTASGPRFETLAAMRHQPDGPCSRKSSCIAKLKECIRAPEPGQSGNTQRAGRFEIRISQVRLPLWRDSHPVRRERVRERMAVTQSGKWGNILPFALLVSFAVWILNSVSQDWFGTQFRGSLGWVCLAVLIAGILLYPLPIMWMKRKAIALATLGDYDEALRISRKWLRAKTYGPKFQGWIMLAAGRYSEALGLLKDSAFDEKGQPLLLRANTSITMRWHSCARKSIPRRSLSLRQRFLRRKRRIFIYVSVWPISLLKTRKPTGPLDLVEQVRGNQTKSPTETESPSIGTMQRDPRLRLAAWSLCQRRGEAQTDFRSLCGIRLFQ